jgi:hypothetical protein
MATGKEDIFVRARELLTLVRDAPSPSLDQLQLALDRIAVAYSEAPAGAHGQREAQQTAPPSRDLIGARFSQLGLYRQAHPDLANEDGALLVGDGIDDLLDICGQMHELLEIAEQVSADAALHELHLLAWHWQWHLRSLSGYLHFLRYGQP